MQGAKFSKNEAYLAYASWTGKLKQRRENRVFLSGIRRAIQQGGKEKEGVAPDLVDSCGLKGLNRAKNRKGVTGLSLKLLDFIGVSDGIRTHSLRGHNPTL